MCDCGNYTITRTDQLGTSNSCGCGSREHWNSKDNPIKKKYTDSDSQRESKYIKLYDTWRHMKERCYYEKCEEYAQWGGRGIKICDEWLNDYNTFKQWSLDNGFDYNKKGHELTIDRINVDRDYSPKNCRWVDMYVQANNKTNNVFVEVNGEHLTLGQCARKYNIPYYRVAHRYYEGVRGNDLILPKYAKLIKTEANI